MALLVVSGEMINDSLSQLLANGSIAVKLVTGVGFERGKHTMVWSRD